VNKTANANPNDGEGHYFELGMVPKYVFASYPLRIELPTYVTFPSSNYYDTTEPDGTPIPHSTVGVFGTGVRVTAPLTFINWRYGRWSVHADFIYQHLFADGVVFDNENFLPPVQGRGIPRMSSVAWPYISNAGGVTESLQAIQVSIAWGGPTKIVPAALMLGAILWHTRVWAHHRSPLRQQWRFIARGIRS